MMSANMIFNTEVIHDDFKRIKTLFTNESEPFWTPEQGYINEHVNFPNRTNRDYNIRFSLTLNELDKNNICGVYQTFFVFIHKPNEILTDYHDGIFLNYGDYMKIKITPHGHRTDNDLRSFSPDLRKCYFEDEKKLKFFKTYSKALCEWECKANATFQKCGCVTFAMPRDKLTKICNFEQMKCALSTISSTCQCYELCIDVTYSNEIYKTPFNRKIYSGLPET